MKNEDTIKITSTFKISQYHASVHFHSSYETKLKFNELPHKAIWWRLLNLLQSRGFDVFKDPYIEKNFKILSPNHRQGKKGYLEFKTHVYPAGFEIEFFQNIVFENNHGGYYDFDKFEKMPYLIKKSFINETNHIKAFLIDNGVKDSSDPIFKSAEEKVFHRIVEYRQMHHPKTPFASLSESLGHSPGQTSNRFDQNKKQLFNGDVKYFRDRKGYLRRGTIYHNINNMWWTILSHNDYTNISTHELFDCIPSQVPRKLVDDRYRTSTLDRLKSRAVKEENYKKAAIIRDLLANESMKVCA